MSLFTVDEERRVSNAITQAERTTSGEIVVVVAARSGPRTPSPHVITADIATAAGGLLLDLRVALDDPTTDPQVLKAEGDRMVGDDIAEEGIRHLQAINFKDRPVGGVSIAAE